MVDVVRQFFAALDKAAQTGNTDDLIAVTYQYCPCRAVVATIKQEYADGGHDVGAHWAVKQLSFLSFEGHSAYVQASSSVSAYRTINRDGSLRAAYASHTRDDFVRLTLVKGRWLVVALYGKNGS